MRRWPIGNGMTQDGLRGLGWALLAVLVAAAYPAVTRLGVTRQAMTPLEMGTLRFTVAGLLLLPVFLRAWPRLGRPQRLEAMLLAVCQGVPLAALIAWGLALAPASHGAALTLGLLPAVILLLNLATGRGVVRQAAWGAAVIAAGAVLLSLSGLESGPHLLLGHGLFVAAAFMGGTYFFRLRHSGFTALEGTAFVSVLSAAGGILAMLATGQMEAVVRLSGETLLIQGLFQGVLVGVVTLVAMNRAIALLGPGPATVCMSLVPAFAAVLAMPMLGEIPSGPEAVAISAMVLGAVLSAAPAWPLPRCFRLRLIAARRMPAA